ncbi:helix-turn-helix transcriptional regulator [Nitrosopumilus zosterae]|uniref:helix-turn-helix transcriptional regulator n=2 Tax=Nitrosopumilus zosterae TaxID=718286 RepID=UPI00220DE94D|nr:transcriptional regulator [Nitrosopumilus zosterae]BDQ30284.1 transcriptional regulator [Nitrosopumilus zosterae]
MAKKKDTLSAEAEKIKAELDALKKKQKVLDSSPSKKKTEPKPPKKKAEAKTKKKTEPKPPKKKAEAKTKKKTEPKPPKKKAEAKTKKKTEPKPLKEKKLTKKELEEAKKEAEKTLEEELEEQLSDEEIENFQIEKVDMERLTNKVCDILAERESDGMFQSELWKKLKLTSRDGSRLALKLERMGTITREKLLEKGRWTYKLILKKTPISTQSIENAPCLVCPVEQKCSLEGEISPRNCQFIEDWVIADMKKPAKTK